VPQLTKTKNKRMKKQIALFTLVAAAFIVAPAVVNAQDKPAKPETAESTAPKAKKHGGLPFKGKVSAVDTNAMTVTLASQTLNITSETKILKEGKPATLGDIAIGEKITGQYKKDDAGKLDATSIHIGGKADTGASKKKKADSTDKN
jgi:hypothetical protein